MDGVESVGTPVGIEAQKSKRKRKPNRKTAVRKRTLEEIRKSPWSTAGGAFGLRAAYLADTLHRGSVIWMRAIRPKEMEWADFLGCDNFEALPISQRSMVKLWMADWLLVNFYAPDDVNAGTKEVRAAMNSLARLTERLHSMKREKRIPSLAEYLASYDQKKADGGEMSQGGSGDDK